VVISVPADVVTPPLLQVGPRSEAAVPVIASANTPTGRSRHGPVSSTTSTTSSGGAGTRRHRTRGEARHTAVESLGSSVDTLRGTLLAGVEVSEHRLSLEYRQRMFPLPS
jgi:hypothetical protein